jgi:hypothetical protein
MITLYNDNVQFNGSNRMSLKIYQHIKEPHKLIAKHCVLTKTMSD